jgi:hypothetical protein
MFKFESFRGILVIFFYLFQPEISKEGLNMAKLV